MYILFSLTSQARRVFTVVITIVIHLHHHHLHLHGYSQEKEGGVLGSHCSYSLSLAIVWVLLTFVHCTISPPKFVFWSLHVKINDTEETYFHVRSWFHKRRFDSYNLFPVYWSSWLKYTFYILWCYVTAKLLLLLSVIFLRACCPSFTIFFIDTCCPHLLISSFSFVLVVCPSSSSPSPLW